MDAVEVGHRLALVREAEREHKKSCRHCRKVLYSGPNCYNEVKKLLSKLEGFYRPDKKYRPPESSCSINTINGRGECYRCGESFAFNNGILPGAVEFAHGVVKLFARLHKRCGISARGEALYKAKMRAITRWEKKHGKGDTEQSSSAAILPSEQLE